MELRKATSSIVFALLAVIMAGSMMTGCSDDDFERPLLTFAKTRSGLPGEVQHVKISAGTHTFSFTGKNKRASSSYVVSWGSGEYSPDFDASVVPRIMNSGELHCLLKDSTKWEMKYVQNSPLAPWWSGWNETRMLMKLNMATYCVVKMTHVVTREVQYDTIPTLSTYIEVPCSVYESLR